MDGMHVSLHLRPVELPYLPEHPVELVLGLHEPKHRRSGEVGERTGVALAVAGPVEHPAPTAGRLLEPPGGEHGVAARRGDEPLDAREPRHERLREVAGPNGLEHRLAELLVGLVAAAQARSAWFPRSTNSSARSNSPALAAAQAAFSQQPQERSARPSRRASSPAAICGA